MNFGDAFICRFPFTSGGFSKPRPALVLFELGLDAVICRLTSAQYSGVLDVVITDWSQAGLLKPSIARHDRLVTAEKSLLKTRRGRLSENDRNAVRNAWNSHMRL